MTNTPSYGYPRVRGIIIFADGTEATIYNKTRKINTRGEVEMELLIYPTERMFTYHDLANKQRNTDGTITIRIPEQYLEPLNDDDYINAWFSYLTYDGKPTRFLERREDVQETQRLYSTIRLKDREVHHLREQVRLMTLAANEDLMQRYRVIERIQRIAITPEDGKETGNTTEGILPESEQQP